LDHSPVPVTVQEAEIKVNLDQNRFSGSLVPGTQVQLMFKSPGYVKTILSVRNAQEKLRRLIQSGDPVKKGQILARVRSDEYQQRLAQAQASLIRARANYKRIATLFAERSVSEAAYDSAEAQYRSSQLEFKATKISYKDTIIRAPFDGIVLSRNIEVGALVSSTTSAFTVGNLDEVKLRFGVPDSLVEMIHLNDIQPILVSAYPGVIFSGRTSRIDAQSDPNTRLYEVEMNIRNTDKKLRAGMIASTSLTLLPKEKEKDEIWIPLNSVVRPKDDPNGYAVFTLQHIGTKQIAIQKKIGLGNVSGNSILVLKGLHPGERVIVRGATLLAENQEVREIRMTP
jgi:multidrug efflux system membrane fusion protein